MPEHLRKCLIDDTLLEIKDFIIEVLKNSKRIKIHSDKYCPKCKRYLDKDNMEMISTEEEALKILKEKYHQQYKLSEIEISHPEDFYSR